MRLFLLTLAVLLALVAAGLAFGWGFGVFNDPGWQRDAGGWLALSLAAFVASTHPATHWIDRKYDRL